MTRCDAGAAADAVLAHGAVLGDVLSALRPGSNNAGLDTVSPVAYLVESLQQALGLIDGARDPAALPTGKAITFAESPVEYIATVVSGSQQALNTSASVQLTDWNTILEAVDIDAAAFLSAVVIIVPLFRALKLSPVLGFILAGVILGSQNLFADNEEVDQICELGIQFLLFEMGLELSVTRLTAMAKYAFGLGFAQVALVNLVFACALLPPGDALGTRVLDAVQPGNADLLQITSFVQAITIGFALSLSSSAFTLQLLQDRGMMGTRFGTATLGVLLFQDISVVPFIVLLPTLLQMTAGGADASSLDVPVMVAGGATSFLDLGVLAVGGRFLALKTYELVAKVDSGADVFVALSLLVVSVFSAGADAIGFSDSLGAFIAGIVLADTPYAHRIIKELRTFKSLFLSLFFVTVGTTIDVDLAIRLIPVVLVMTGTLIATKVSVVAGAGRLVGLTWQEALVTGAFLSQGGEFSFVIFGQVAGGRGGLFPMDLDHLLVVVVVLSMALTPLVVDAAFSVAGPVFDEPRDSDDAVEVEPQPEALRLPEPERGALRLPAQEEDEQGEEVVVETTAPSPRGRADG